MYAYDTTLMFTQSDNINVKSNVNEEVNNVAKW